MLEAEGGKVLGILVLHLSIENLVAVGNPQSLWEARVPIRTHPMIKAAAVRMCFPSPSGFFGTGEIEKLSSVRRGAAVAVTIALGAEEKNRPMREGKFLWPRPEFSSGGRILEMTLLFQSRLIQQPAVDH